MLALVTGARGAIGRAVVQSARGQGYSVAGVGHGAWSGDPELPPIDHWINGSVDADNLAALLRAAGPPDVIIHLAGGSAVGPSITQPAEDFRRTVTSAQQVLEWARTSAPSARIVIASSAAIYGGGHHGPIVEDMPAAPGSPYGAHKSIVEVLARSFGGTFELQVAIVRLFSVYGPGLRKQVVWDLARRLVGGERAIVLGGTGNEQRDFVEIRDAGALLMQAAALADTTVPVFNGTSGRATSIASMAGLLASRFAGAEIKFSGISRPGDPAVLVGDDRRARAVGLVAATPLETGLGQTLDWILTSPTNRNAAR